MAADVPSEGLGAVSVLLHHRPHDTVECTNQILSLLLHVSEMKGQEIQDFIDVLDRDLDSLQADSDVARKLFRALRKISGGTGMLPSSYMLSEGLTKSGGVPAASGGFADVWQGLFHNHQVAIKYLRVYRDDDLEKLKRTFFKEVVIWKRLSHANILPLYGVSTTLFPFCLVSPWMVNGNVTEYVNANPEADRVQLLIDAGEGLKFLHELEIVHGDLKGANILINESQRACLADFGMASILSNLNPLNETTLISRPNGTARWMAPELLDPEMFNMPTLPNIRFSIASDIYAFGMVIVEVFTGKKPFQEFPNDPSVIFKVMKGEQPMRPERSQAVGLSDRVWELVQTCWERDAGQRPAISLVLEVLRAEATPHSSSTPLPQATEPKPPFYLTSLEDSSSSVTLPSQFTKMSDGEITSPGDAKPSPTPIPAPTADNSVGDMWPKRLFLRALSFFLSR